MQRLWMIAQADNGFTCSDVTGSTRTVHAGEPAEALADLLFEHFESLFRTKHRGGLVIRVAGRRTSEDDILAAAYEVIDALPPELRSPVARALNLLQGVDSDA